MSAADAEPRWLGRATAHWQVASPGSAMRYCHSQFGAPRLLLGPAASAESPRRPHFRDGAAGRSTNQISSPPLLYCRLPSLVHAAVQRCV